MPTRIWSCRNFRPDDWTIFVDKRSNPTDMRVAYLHILALQKDALYLWGWFDRLRIKKNGDLDGNRVHFAQAGIITPEDIYENWRCNTDFTSNLFLCPLFKQTLPLPFRLPKDKKLSRALSPVPFPTISSSTITPICFNVPFLPNLPLGTMQATLRAPEN